MNEIGATDGEHCVGSVPAAAGAIEKNPMRTEATFVDVQPSDGFLRKQHAKLAASKGKHAFVYVCSTILPPSVAIDETLDDPMMRDAFSENYIIRLDVHAWGAAGTEGLLEGSGI